LNFRIQTVFNKLKQQLKTDYKCADNQVNLNQKYIITQSQIRESEKYAYIVDTIQAVV